MRGRSLLYAASSSFAGKSNGWLPDVAGTGLTGRRLSTPVVLLVTDAQDVRDGAQVLELVGVDDATHGLDHAVEDLEREHTDDLVLLVVGDDPWAAVDEDRFKSYPQSLGPSEQLDEESGDLFSSEDGVGRAGRLAASVAVEGGIRSQEVD